MGGTLVTDFVKMVGGPVAVVSIAGVDLQAVLAVGAALALGFVAFRTQVLKLVKAERDELARRVELLTRENDRLAAENLELASRPTVEGLAVVAAQQTKILEGVVATLADIRTAVVPPTSIHD